MTLRKELGQRDASASLGDRLHAEAQMDRARTCGSPAACCPRCHRLQFACRAAHHQISAPEPPYLAACAHSRVLEERQRAEWQASQAARKLSEKGTAVVHDARRHESN